MAPQQFAVDIPITDLDLEEDIEDFRIQHEETDNDFHKQLDLRDLNFGPNPNIIQRGIRAIGNIFKNRSQFTELNSNFNDNDCVDEIELLSRGRGDGHSSFDLDSGFHHFKQSKKSLLRECFKVLLSSKILIFSLLLSNIGLLIVVIVILSKRSKISKVNTPFEESTASVSSLLTIVISIEGLHPHFISFENMPYLSNLMNSTASVYAPFMIPSNPTLELANLWAISTGLKPYENGIVGQSFYDDELHEQFISENFDSKWYKGSPIWDLVTQNNLRFQSINWPFTNNEPKIKNMELYEQFQLFESFVSDNQTNLILSHVRYLESTIQSTGLAGINLRMDLLTIDDFLETSFRLIHSTRPNANIVIISEGGYVPISKDRTIKLESIIDIDKFQFIERSTILGLYPKNHDDLDLLIEEIKNNLAKFSFGDNFAVFRNEKIQEHVYGGKNNRIPPILVIPSAGYLIDYGIDNIDKLECISGYLSDELLSRSVFIATGPFFNNSINLKPFENIEIFNIITDSLQITTSKSIYTNPDFLLPEDWKDDKEYPGITGFDMDIIKAESVIETKYETKLSELITETEIDEIDGLDPIKTEPGDFEYGSAKPGLENSDSKSENSAESPNSEQTNADQLDYGKEDEDIKENEDDNEYYDEDEKESNDEDNDADTDDNERDSLLSAWWNRISSAIDRVVEDVEDKFNHQEENSK